MSVLTTKDKGSARKVGTHRRDALDELTRQAEDLGLYNA